MAAKYIQGAWLIASALIASCASSPSPRVDDARLARLPPEQREALIDQHRAVDIAQSNFETAKVAMQDAEQFRSIVQNEQAGARERAAGAKKSVELTAKTGGVNQNGLVGARNDEALAAQRLDAANGKMQYAENLLNLRKRQVELRQAELTLAKANMEAERYERLAAANEANGMKREDFVKARDEAQHAVIDKKTAVDQSRVTVQASQRAWNDMHHRYNTAAQAVGDTTSEAPPPPAPID